LDLLISGTSASRDVLLASVLEFCGKVDGFLDAERD
jgi:hypothetical protein